MSYAMLVQNSYTSTAAAHRKRGRPSAFPVRMPFPLHPVYQVLWQPAKLVADSSAALVAVAVLSIAPPAHALGVPTDASKHLPVEVSQLQASGAATSAAQRNPLADLGAGFFGGGDDVPDERDPITPFTLYGTNFKKYLIEQLQGEKIISRKKGFTVDACVGAVEVSQETPQFQGLPTGDKALYAKNRVCRKSEGGDLKETCRAACEAACNDTLDSYGQQITQESGFALLASDKARLVRSCLRSCAYECGKPGKAFDFVIPYRR